MKKILRSKFTVVRCCVAALVCVASAGCFSKLGTNSLNLTSQVLDNGTLIGASLTLASNMFSLGANYKPPGTNLAVSSTLKVTN